ncbi:MAG: acyl carrier protein [Fimbriimonas sp.]|nr:acyl carrier protein [Fimbriimonas sp.]
MIDQKPSPLHSEIIGVCASVLRVPNEKLVPEARLVEDLDVDSLFVVELAMALEEKFQIEVPEQELPALKTVADIIAYIERRVEAA